MKLGELFVELGVDSGNAMGKLSNFAFKFNNVAEMAKKMQKGLENFGGAKQMATFSRTILDLAKNLNLTTNNIQGLRRAASMSGADFDTMTSKLAEFEKRRINAITGRDRSFFQEYAKYGVDVGQLYGSRNPLQTMRALVGNLSNIKSERERQAFSASAGFSVREMDAWRDYFENQNEYDNDLLNLTREQLEQNAKLNTSLNNLAIKLEDAGNKIQQNLMPTLDKIINVVNKVIDHFNKDKAQDFVENYPLLSFLHPVAAYQKLVGHGAGLANELGLGNTSLKKEAGISFLAQQVSPYLGLGMTSFTLSDAITTGVLNIAGGKTKQNPLFNQSLAYQFYRNKGYSDSSAKALVGNLIGESGINPIAIGDKGASFGIAQWRGSRRKALEEFARKKGASPNDLMTQLEFTVSETGESHNISPEKLNKLSMEEAVGVIVNKYERSSNRELDISKRITHARGLDFSSLENSNMGGSNVVYNNNKRTNVYTTADNIPNVIKADGELDREINLGYGGYW